MQVVTVPASNRPTIATAFDLEGHRNTQTKSRQHSTTNAPTKTAGFQSGSAANSNAEKTKLFSRVTADAALVTNLDPKALLNGFQSLRLCDSCKVLSESEMISAAELPLRY